jgi:hypothetical protein
MAADPDADRAQSQRGIAQSERLVLLVFGGLTAFTGFVVLFLDVPPLFRLGVGVPVAAVGAALCSLAVRSAEAVEREDITPFALLAIERMAMLPLAAISTFGALVVLFAAQLAWYTRLMVFSGAATLAATFWLLIIRNRLPERTPRVQAPDRSLQNTED